MTDWTKLSADLERLLKLRSHVFAMKLFERGEEMEAIPRIRRPQSLRLERRRRVGLRRFLGPGVEDPHPEPVDPVLCRAPLWRGARRRDADGAAAGLSAEGDRRHGGAVEERAALSVPAIRHPA